MQRLLALFVCAFLGLGLAACSSSSKSSDSGGSSSADITMKDFQFGGAMSVKAGATVTVKNNGGTTHTATADNGEFDSGDVSPGSTKTFTAPSTPGEYKFHCNFHPTQMQATLHVT